MSHNLPPVTSSSSTEGVFSPAGLPPIPPFPKERPTGVTVLAVLNFVGAGLALILVAVALLTAGNIPEAGSDFLSELQARSRADLVRTTVITGIVAVAICLVLGIGLWRLRPWARIAAIIAYGGGAVLNLCANFNEAITVAMLVRLAVAAGVIYDLLQPHVDEAFGDFGQTR